MIGRGAVELVLPDLRYARSYLQARAEGFCDHSPPRSAPEPVLDADTVGAHLITLNQPWAPDPAVEPVRFAHFWIVAGDELIGRVGVRYALNERLLRCGGHVGYEIRPRERRRGFGHLALSLGLARLEASGVRTALVTCSDDNVGSARIIERAGGVLENKVTHPDDEEVVMRRYWIGD